MDKIKKITITLLFLACVLIYSSSAITIESGQVFSVSLDLSKPRFIVWPCEITIVGEMGEKGLRIGPNVGRGWKGEADGEATYKFFIPKDDVYHIWAYCLWFDICTNAVFIQVDDAEKTILGNDPVYKQWHWIRGFSIKLERGTHTLTLSNHSDNIAIQKIVFTNSQFKAPKECALVFSEMFYDDFNGCDHGNFATWQIESGKWYVKGRTGDKDINENMLRGHSEKNILIMNGDESWTDYSLSLLVRVSKPESENWVLEVCFGMQDDKNYSLLKIRPINNQDKAMFTLGARKDENYIVETEWQASWQTDHWYHIEITPERGSVFVSINGKEMRRFPLRTRITGGIGLRLQGVMIADFDDIHVRYIFEQ